MPTVDEHFAGAVRKRHIVLTIKSEQTSAKRFHHEVKLTSVKDRDAELRGWLKAAYDLSA